MGPSKTEDSGFPSPQRREPRRTTPFHRGWQGLSLPQNRHRLPTSAALKTLAAITSVMKGVHREHLVAYASFFLAITVSYLCNGFMECCDQQQFSLPKDTLL